MNASYKWMKANHYVFGLVQGALSRRLVREQEGIRAHRASPSGHFHDGPHDAMPPGPSVPRVLQTLAFVTSPEPFIRACRRRYGDVLTFSTVFEKRFVMVFEPRLATRVLQEPDDVLSGAEANLPLSPVLGPRSLGMVENAEHLRLRRLMLPAFHGEQLAAYEQAITEAANRMIDSWPEGETFPLLPSLSEMTFEVIARVVLGIDDRVRVQDLHGRVDDVLSIGDRVALALLLASGGRFGLRRRMADFDSRLRRLDEVIYAEMRSRSDADSGTDVLSALLSAGMPEREIRDEVVTLLVASHETSATALAWALDLLLHHPGTLGRARSEADAGGTTYLHALVKETLRHRTIVPTVGRVVRGQPYALNGYSVPPGIEINPAFATIHRLHEDPHTFRPERFLGSRDVGAYLPFGAGARRCLGASFAPFEMVVVLRQILTRAALVATHRPETGTRKNFTVRPKHGVRVVLRARIAPAPSRAAAPSPSTA